MEKGGIFGSHSDSKHSGDSTSITLLLDLNENCFEVPLHQIVRFKLEDDLLDLLGQGDRDYCTFLNYSAGGVTRDTLAEFVHQANLLVTWDICPISARAINSTA